MLVKYAPLWLFTLPFSPCNLYVPFTSHFRLIYSGLSWRHRIFLLPCSQCCVQHMSCVYACSLELCMYVNYTLSVCIPHRDIIPHFVGDGEIN